MKALRTVVGAAVILAPLIAAGGAAAMETETIRLYATGSTKAELHDCGCKKKPLGGLARRAFMLGENDVAPENTLILDAGDWAELNKDHAWEKSELVWNMMADMGYEAVTPGARELGHGRSALEGLYNSRPEVEVVSANITDKAGNRVWPEFAVVDKAGRKVAVTGVTGSAPYVFNLTRGIQAGDDFDFADPTETLLELVPRMKAQADLVVLLCNTSPADAKRLVDEVPGIDVLVVGYNPGYQFNVERQASTLVLRGGSQGKYLNRLDLVMDAEGLLDYNGEALPVHKRLTEHPEYAERVTRWETQYEVAAN